ncbi:VESICLE-ASSOCIATED PROTEIN 1-2-LIKE [Salix koriyanagi]|uniref:VESICLE-ASSOCIATED PROTEIN 1-2-LIKE n=1 Tax=Salix koriyanagi TaxID=2511006 RepID=A0A9Q0PXF8_9ROSI|nr:VESICLE-ASSOCIATED PROTEIN 1-2-LIKE [Salix koriyanagi]
MSTGELLSIEPLELKFPFELKKQISCSLQLSNNTDNYVAFKVKTTNPKKYCVRPNAGIVLPRSTCDVIVTMQAQKEAPPDIHCKDKFLLQSVKANDGVTAKDINAEMFSKEAGHLVEECKLRVLYVSPPQPPSPVHEGSEEGSSPRGSVSDNGNVNGADLSTATRAFVERLEPQEKSLEARALISKLTGEKNNAIQQNNKLRQELNTSQGPLPVMHRFWSSKSIPEQQNKLSHPLIVVDRLKPLTVSANTNISASIVGLYSLAASGPSYLLSKAHELLRHQGNKNRGGVSIMFVIFVGLLGIFLGYLVKKT